MSEDAHAMVSAATARAEAKTDGEIVTVVAARSDAYHDVAAHWAALAMISAPALLAIRPDWADRLYALAGHDWTTPSPSALFTVALLAGCAFFLLGRALLAVQPIRLALTPPSTKARRVRRRALELFRASAEKRTRASTAVLIYLSVAERRAEIVADEAIHAKVGEEVWGDAMRALLEEVRHDRVGAGLSAVIDRVGIVLASHFPPSGDNPNELPDRLIEL